MKVKAQKKFTKDDAMKMALEIVANNKYTTICQDISKPQTWKRVG